MPNPWPQIDDRFLPIGKVGDLIYSARASVPGYLQANGQIVSQSEYPELFGQVGLLADELGTWTPQTVPVTTQDSRAMAHGGGVCVAVGTGGYIMSSSDGGANWTARTSGTAENLRCIAYADGQFVAGGANGTILTSPDGVTWTLRTTPTTAQLDGVAYGNSTWVMLTWSSECWTSPDAVTWTRRTSVYSGSRQWITFGNGVFAAVRQSGGEVSTSADGITWTLRQSSQGANSDLYDITFANGIFVMGGSYLWHYSRSYDGIVWEGVGLSADGCNALSYGSGIWVSVAPTKAFFSLYPDARNWRRHIYDAGILVGSVGKLSMFYLDGRFVAAYDDFKVWAATPTYSYNTGTHFRLPTVPSQGLLKPWLKAA